MESFERLLEENMRALQRFIFFRVSHRYDAEDILQETCAAAARDKGKLENVEAFRAWLFSIARHKCADYYRTRAQDREILMDAVPESSSASGIDAGDETAVRDTLDALSSRDKQILFLFYFREWPQIRIPQRLNIPLGTVKSRLHNARDSFREKYPYPPKEKGACNMFTMPEKMPEYTIEKSSLPPFAVRWEETMGWFIVPKLGEKLTWAMYDFPEKTRTEQCAMEVLGPAEVHGIEGVEIKAVETDPMDCNSAGGQAEVERHFVAQLTDTHCRILAESHMENGIKKYYTFLDGGDFLDNWGFGEDNCGNEVNLAPKGDIIREGNAVTTADKQFLLDVVGRYTVTIGGKAYDTVCVMDFDTYNEGTVSEQFLDRHGRTVLWRRFNRNDWRFDSHHKLWTDLLPHNERLTVNGETYVHWYDCITDYILTK
ncbi:MAG: RNA polymerase sigma factor [Clostridia bacterium]|nr:RNA polymerase sigma factor [Clostridia bacterium]